MNDSDWRIQNQESYLTGATLFRRRWQQTRPHWEHDHCEFCGAKFSAEAGDLSDGWSTEDESQWICDVCFADFRERFG